MAEFDASTVAWIFLATDLASGSGLASRRGISEVADAINHAVPLEAELNESFRFLASNGYLTMQGKHFSITTKGRDVLAQARTGRVTVFDIWKSLEQILSSSTNGVGA